MPGAVIARDELDKLAVTANEKMGRHAQFANFRVERMPRDIEAILEKGKNVVAAKRPWWQADCMDDEQDRHFANRARIEIRRRFLAHPLQPAIAKSRGGHQSSMPRRSMRYRKERKVTPSSRAAAVRLPPVLPRASMIA